MFIFLCYCNQRCPIHAIFCFCISPACAHIFEFLGIWCTIVVRSSYNNYLQYHLLFCIFLYYQQIFVPSWTHAVHCICTASCLNQTFLLSTIILWCLFVKKLLTQFDLFLITVFSMLLILLVAFMRHRVESPVKSFLKIKKIESILFSLFNHFEQSSITHSTM